MKLILLDEINCHFTGLTPTETAFVIKQTELPVAGAFMSMAYKNGIWNGKESLFDENGLTFQFMIDDVLTALDEFGSNIDDITIVDEREAPILPQGLTVSDDWLLKEAGFYLRPFQTIAINKTLEMHKGVFNGATASGKSLISLGISKAIDPYTKSVIVVPSENLAIQTYKDYEKSDLSCILFTPKIKVKDREQKIKDHRHIIITTKLFMNCIQWFKNEHFALILDEVHNTCGEVMRDILRLEIPHWQVRIGLTGTVPKDKLKTLNILSHLGGGVIHKVSPSELQEGGYASTVDIEMISTYHPHIEDLFEQMYNTRDTQGNRAFDWSVEQDYLWTNTQRIREIAVYLNSLDKTNTLVLCHPQLGVQLAPLVSSNGCITDDVPPETRREWLSQLDSERDYTQVASFATSGTGLSYNHIYRVVLIDVGKTYSTILQSIGRGMRLDGITNHVNVIDISSNTIYSQRHRKEREKIYKQEKFSYTISETKINIKGNDV